MLYYFSKISSSIFKNEFLILSLLYIIHKYKQISVVTQLSNTKKDQQKIKKHT